MGAALMAGCKAISKQPKEQCKIKEETGGWASACDQNKEEILILFLGDSLLMHDIFYLKFFLQQFSIALNDHFKGLSKGL